MQKSSIFSIRKSGVISILGIFISFFFSGCSKDPLTLIIPEKTTDITTSNLSYEDKTNLSYGTSPYQKYDISLPSTCNSQSPVIVLLHGGAWRYSDKNTLNFLVTDLKNRRVNCAIVNANYRLASVGSGVTFREQVADIGTLLHKLQNDAKSLGIGNEFYLVGLSSGGHLALLYTSSADDDHLVSGIAGIVPPLNLTSPEIRTGIIGADIQQVIGKPYSQAPEEYQNASPIYHANLGKIPTILFYGGKDNIITTEQSMTAKLTVTKKLACNEHYFYPDQTHDWSAWTETIDHIISFAEKNL
ncbi:acetyl esterase/lipase [Arcicella aurantiaca]|uniref:Acetyl esterase/lipase n=1 Tax=Arcicella aurantiaca TaxID=591202 RepID=A0A316DGU0_9BACT|nr:alpha/beta hydrolase [Arcicella aurantiaca]PWK16838.1 acetyl esterase/lipase [Arcicella aurantiaca]